MRVWVGSDQPALGYDCASDRPDPAIDTNEGDAPSPPAITPPNRPTLS